MLDRALARLGGAGGLAGAGLAAWSLFEAQWVELVERGVPVPGLHRDLEGFRILHLSDFHLGTRSLNGRALAKALAWARRLELDLVAVTGDLLSRRRGEPTLEASLADLRARHGIYAVLGNHDIAKTRDPFSEAGDLSAVTGSGAVLLACSERSFEVGAARVQVVGVDPEAFASRRARPAELADPGADFRILLCHFPDVVRWPPPGAWRTLPP